ncbi:hypothetical protein GGR56DRAFT_616058 [Xylariaceae sp. FL0804]|nr:hypothetical protein GGR56DRAFT_616058 [Xylariaceae sp. FL0804]
MTNPPADVLLIILEHVIQVCSRRKSDVLQLRLVCRLFRDFLAPFVFSQLQFQYSKVRTHRHQSPLDNGALRRVGHWCRSMYFDLDWEKSCDLGDSGKSMLGENPPYEEFIDVLQWTPELDKVHLVLPRRHPCHAAAYWRVMNALGRRPADHPVLETLVLDNLDPWFITWDMSRTLYFEDTHSFEKLWGGLKHLHVSIRNGNSGDHLLLHYATNLHSLSVMDEDQEKSCLREPYTDYIYPSTNSPLGDNLTSLSLRSILSIAPRFRGAFRRLSATLEELYLVNVGIDISNSPPTSQLWVGLPNQLPDEANRAWVATSLRHHGRRLRIVRASNLRYIRYGQAPAFEVEDVADPCCDGGGLVPRSFEQRFVEVATGVVQPPGRYFGLPMAYLTHDVEASRVADVARPGPHGGATMPEADWSASAYLQQHRCTPGGWERTLDRWFCSEPAYRRNDRPEHGE